MNAPLSIPQGNAPAYHLQNDTEIQSRKHTILVYLLHAQRLTITNRKQIEGFHSTTTVHGLTKKCFVCMEFSNIPKSELKTMSVLKVGQCLKTWNKKIILEN